MWSEKGASFTSIWQKMEAASVSNATSSWSDSIPAYKTVKKNLKMWYLKHE